MTTALPPSDLAQLVREVIRDALPELLAESIGGTAKSPRATTTDADLDALVKHVAALCDDPRARAELKSGKRTVSWNDVAGQPKSHAAVPAATSKAAHRVERGAVTERAVLAAHQAGATLIVGRRAVLTPLARDRARALGVITEKEM